MAKQYAMIHDENLCIGCQACAVACRNENEVPDNFWRLQVWIKSSKLKDGRPSFAYHRQSCVTCENTPCERVCPTKATFTDENGIVDIDVNLCVGCLYCVAACPYQARYVHPEHGAPDKCNLCKHTMLARGEENTACVQICPTDALTFGDISDPNSEISRKLSSTVTYRQKERLGTIPRLFVVPNKKGGVLS